MKEIISRDRAFKNVTTIGDNLPWFGNREMLENWITWNSLFQGLDCDIFGISPYCVSTLLVRDISSITCYFPGPYLDLSFPALRTVLVWKVENQKN